MIIAFFELEGWEEKIIREHFPDAEIQVIQSKLDALTLPEQRDAEIISIFVDSKIDQAVLDAFPNLKCITTRSTGYDHIDLAACATRKIPALYVPGYGDNTVAEFAFGLLLNLTRKIYQGIDQIKETGSFSLANFRGIDLKGKTIGIVGTGRIGKESAKIAKGFGMNVIAYDPYPDQAFAAQAGITYMGLDDLLKVADVVTIHCPYNKDTHHLLNGTNLAVMKRGAYLINTARGAIVETEELIKALEQGILAGYGTDVLEEEGETKDELHFLTSGHPNEEELKVMIRNHVLMKMPNVLITPHMAFDSQEAIERILKTTMGNISSFIEGEPENTAH